MFKIQSLWAHKQSTSPNLIKHFIYINNLVAKLLEKDAIISKHLCNVQSIWLHKCRCLLCAIYRQLASPWWLIEWTKLEKHQNICFIFDQISCLYEPAAMELLLILSSTSLSRWSAESVSSKAWKCGCDTHTSYLSFFFYTDKIFGEWNLHRKTRKLRQTKVCIVIHVV